MRIDDFVMHKISVLIQTDRLASVTESRVYRHCPFLAHRCSEKQLAQVFSENTNRLLVGLQLELLQYFTGDGRFYKTLVGIIYSHTDLLCKFTCRISALLTEVIIYLVSAFLRISVDLHVQPSLRLPSQYRQKPVSRNSRKRFRIIEIVLELLGLKILLSGLGHLGHHTPCTEYRPHRLPDLG